MSPIDTEIAVTHYTRPDIKVPGLKAAGPVNMSSFHKERLCKPTIPPCKKQCNGSSRNSKNSRLI
jgi:hypothetical protein